MTLINLLILFILISSFRTDDGGESVYKVVRIPKAMKIDGNWNKNQWQKAGSLDITNYMGKIPGFKPVAKAKMMYDDENIYVIFQVQDR